MFRRISVIAGAIILATLLGLFGGVAKATSGPMPHGVPASYAGTLRLNLDGRQLYEQFPQSHGGADCASGGRLSVTSQGWLSLYTSGNVGDCAEVRSPGVTWTAGVFEAQIWTRYSGYGHITDWPAYWMSGQTWPADGEIDAFEADNSCSYSRYHYSLNGAEATIGPALDTCVGHWHIVDIVRTLSGHIEVWFDGVRKFSYNSGECKPMTILFDVTASVQGGPSYMYVNYERAWDYK